jgi:diguanylate cyclase (GGDEF)-like protein
MLLEHSARLDSLTGLPLRYGLEDEFARFRMVARQFGMKTAVMMIDVDHFKRINDKYGHAVGDLALKHVAGILCGQARGGALTFRFGGEEFLQLVRADAAGDVEAAAGRLLQALRDNPMVLPDGGLVHVRASAGVAVAEHDEEMGQAIERADHALYAAKAAGRDCVRWAEPANLDATTISPDLIAL